MWPWILTRSFGDNDGIHGLVRGYVTPPVPAAGSLGKHVAAGFHLPEAVVQALLFPQHPVVIHGEGHTQRHHHLCRVQYVVRQTVYDL